MLQNLVDLTALNGLRLDDGRWVRDLESGPLFRELVKAGVPGISPSTGRQDLLTAFARHRAEQDTPPPYELAERAAEVERRRLFDEQARGWTTQPEDAA